VITSIHARTSGEVGTSPALTHPSLCCSKTEAKAALLYHYSSIGFAARLAPEHAHQLSSECTWLI
jgi:hypothetical protein